MMGVKSCLVVCLCDKMKEGHTTLFLQHSVVGRGGSEELSMRGTTTRAMNGRRGESPVVPFLVIMIAGWASAWAKA